CLQELSEDDSEDYNMCCGFLHPYVMCIIFCIMDLLTLLITTSFYVYYNRNEEVLGWLTIAPLVALFISAGIYPTGPYGLLFGVIFPLKLYYYRIIAIIAFSFILSLMARV
uniref:Uncharacterized protein n=1 Tax=Parascaris univalens TaxID=6257 RepID=A0A915B1F9_PARUN